MSKRNNVCQICESLNLTEFTIPTLEGEIWKPLITPLYPSIKPDYYISNKNRVYSTIKNDFLNVYHTDPGKFNSPYYSVYLYDINNTTKKYLMHRLLMSIFKPVYNMENLCINHIDGNKLNNNLDNLEWCTVQENTIHALNTGLFVPVYGEEHVCATITEDDAKKIIELLLKRRFNYETIASMTNSTPTIVADIAKKKSWKHLTKNIDREKMMYSLKGPRNITIDNIHDICKYFEDNPKSENMSIRRHCMNALNYINYKPIGEGILNSVRKVYSHERFIDISSQYNF